jgi:hypothetical protein
MMHKKHTMFAIHFHHRAMLHDHDAIHHPVM